MAIEIFDKAAIVKKGGIYYYLLKQGSKNTFTCPFQYVIDNKFGSKYIRRESRSSDWRVVAIGTYAEFLSDSIADTKFNCPQAMAYGEIRFGNGKNIARYYVWLRHANKVIDFDTLGNMEKMNVDKILGYPSRAINLSNIPMDKRMPESYESCEHDVPPNWEFWKGLRFWNNGDF